MRYALIALLGVLFMAFGTVLISRNAARGPAPAEPAGLSEPAAEAGPLPAFALEGTAGGFDNAALNGHWTYVFFGYTHCPDVCPAALGLLKEVFQQLPPASAASPAPSFRVAFVSLDAERDSIALLKEYLAAFDPRFIGARGDEAMLAPLRAALGVEYRRGEGSGGNYSVDHTATIFLIAPDGRLAARFPPPQSAARLLEEGRRMAGGKRQP